MKVVRVVSGAVPLIAMLVALLPSTGSAMPMTQGTWALARELPASNLWHAHGFHCRKEAGWDPTTGYFRYHRHAGICSDYARCLNAHKRCIVRFHKGWTEWKSERWGFENRKYTYCMAKRGCI